MLSGIYAWLAKAAHRDHRSNAEAENDDLTAKEAIENRQLFRMADEREVEIGNSELLDADLTDINKKCRWVMRICATRSS